MTGDDFGGVGQGPKMVMDGVQQLAGVASGQVGAADGAGEESVSGDEEALLGKVEADAALGVAGGVEDGAGEAGRSLVWWGAVEFGLGAGLKAGADGDEAAVGEVVVGRGDLGGGDTEPAGLDVDHLNQGEIVLVVKHGGAGDLLEALSAGDVVDVGVGDEDLLDGELVLLQQGQDAADVIAGIDHDGLAGGLVAEDGAVALERTDSEDFMDHRDHSRVLVVGCK